MRRLEGGDWKSASNGNSLVAYPTSSTVLNGRGGENNIPPRPNQRAGGSFTKFSTQTTALSQTHLNGERIKKSLSDRVHHDLTGIVMHRDLFSAYLSRFVNQDELSLQDAEYQYQRSEPILMEAWKRYQQTANRVGESESPQSGSSAERFSSKLGKFSQISTEGLKAVPDS